MFACRSTVAGDEIAPMSTQTSVDGGTEKDSYHSFEANDNAADAPQTPPPPANNPSSSSSAPLVSTNELRQAQIIFSKFWRPEYFHQSITDIRTH